LKVAAAAAEGVHGAVTDAGRLFLRSFLRADMELVLGAVRPPKRTFGQTSAVFSV
jgi:hypothetical protein